MWWFGALVCSGFRVGCGAFLRAWLVVSGGSAVPWFGCDCVSCGCCGISFLVGCFRFEFVVVFGFLCGGLDWFVVVLFLSVCFVLAFLALGC